MDPVTLALANARTNVKNLIPNGDLSTPLTQSNVPIGGVQVWSRAYFTTFDGYQVIDGIYSDDWRSSRIVFDSVVGHKYYITSLVWGITNFWDPIAQIFFARRDNADWGRLSAVLTSAETPQEVWLRSFYVTGGAGQGYYRNLLVIDLTSTFGAGNEPTADVMDYVMDGFADGWFRGTQNLFFAFAGGVMRQIADLKNAVISLGGGA